MAIKNTNDLTVQMNTLLPDNSTQLISPQDHRDSLGDTIDSLINKLDNKPLLGAKEYDALRGITTGLAYESGELCIESGVLYQANIGILGAQVFTPANWTNLTPSQTAVNGLNVSGGNVRMGGTIISPTNVSSISNANFLRFNTTDGRVAITGTDTISASNTLGFGEVTPFAPRARGVISNIDGYNDEAIGVDSSVTGGSTLSIAGKFLAQLSNDEGIAGLFDAANNTNHNRALVTDRGEIGFGWTDFDASVTNALINVKPLNDSAVQYTVARHDSTGVTRVSSVSNSGRSFMENGGSYGYDGSGTDTALLNLTSDNYAIGFQIRNNHLN